MPQITMEVPDQLAERLEPIAPWLSTILELGLVGFRSRAVETATEVVQFLLTNPAPEDVLDFHVSANSQEGLRRLLALNAAGILGEQEQLEMDELQQVEHILIMLKADVAQRLRGA